MKKQQRKVNRIIRLFNNGFANDIWPYNQFRLKQAKRVNEREPYEADFLIDLYKGDSLIASKWFDYMEIAYTSHQFYKWLNNEVVRAVNKEVK